MTSIPEWVRRARARWHYVGQERPPFASVPGPGQESVWDYPRPPRVVPDAREVLIRVGNVQIARSSRCLRVLETASPPTLYLLPDDVHSEYLRLAPGGSFCEWKGEARYWTIVAAGATLDRAAWSYPDPLPGFEELRDYLAFYPAKVMCYLDAVQVTAQPGRFYGGWVTPDILGPFKGEPGSEDW